MRDAAGLYKADRGLAANDFNPDGFKWINADDGNYSVYSFLRFDDDGKTCYAVISNFTPVKRQEYGLGLPFKGKWREVLNTDALCYCGSGAGNCGGVEAEELPMNNLPYGALLTLPPMSTLVLKHEETPL